MTLWSLTLLPGAVGTVLLAFRPHGRWVLGVVACATLLFTLLLSALAAGGGWSGHLEWSRALVLTAALTPLSATVALLVPATALPILLYAVAHEERPGLGRLVALLLLFVGGMELLVIADDLLTLLIGWEVVGACSWALIAHHWQKIENPRGALYAFLATRTGDLGLFVAAIATYAGSGSFRYEAIPTLTGPQLQLVAFGILLSAAAKSAQLPFSPWLFRAMAGPTSVSALLHAAAMVAAGAYLLARLEPTLGPVEGFPEATITVGLATALAGGLVAMLQGHAKKLLAASTSMHYGLMLVAVGTGYPGVAILHMVAHAAFKAAMFLVAGMAEKGAGGFALHRMRLGRALPLTAALGAVAALALAGVPPLGGGWTKEAVIAAAGHADLVIAVAVALAGGLGAAYAARFQLLAFGRGAGRAPERTPRAAEHTAVALLAAISLALGILWLPVTHHPLAELLSAAIPKSKPWELATSLGLLVAGLLAGALLARRRPTLGCQGASAAAAEWFGLPVLVRAVVVRPVVGLAAAAAWFDDHVIDSAARALVPTSLSRAAGWFDDHVVDPAVHALVPASLGRFGDRFGERFSDGIPEGSAVAVGFSGRQVRRLQTGMAHHYYALIAAGAAAIAAVMAMGA